MMLFLGAYCRWIMLEHRELLDGRLCRPDSKQWPWTSIIYVLWLPTYGKIMLAQLPTKCKFKIFCVSTICYRPTDISLLKEFSKNVSFWEIYTFIRYAATTSHKVLISWFFVPSIFIGHVTFMLRYDQIYQMKTIKLTYPY